MHETIADIVTTEFQKHEDSYLVLHEQIETQQAIIQDLKTRLHENDKQIQHQFEALTQKVDQNHIYHNQTLDSHTKEMTRQYTDSNNESNLRFTQLYTKMDKTNETIAKTSEGIDSLVIMMKFLNPNIYEDAGLTPPAPNPTALNTIKS
jgi:uncharacterized protein YdiU (UPF0061 family)